MSKSQNKKGILVVDDAQFIRNRIKKAIEKIKFCEVVGEVSNGVDLTEISDMEDWIYGVHLAWSPGILYFSWDAAFLPEEIIYGITTEYDGETEIS